jgi:multiple sugar transport system substrate-binding protein
LTFVTLVKAFGIVLLWASTCARAAAASIEIRHVLWDANQRPMYQQCAKDFEAANPGVRIRIRQLGWDDYWTNLSTGFVAGTAPDVFTHHASKFAEFALNGVMLDLSAWIARDRVDPDSYESGLWLLWQHQSRSYALPADWDTIALAVNLEHVRKAGVSLEELERLDWNPRDGGSFGRVIARLTTDDRGRRADEPGFDPRRVAVHGYMNPGAGGMMGQSEWSHFAASAGWRYQDAPWDGALRYDDPVFIDTMHWLASLPPRGVAPTPEAVGKLGSDAMFLAGRVAIVPTGTWMVGHFARNVRFEQAWVRLPVGPSGHRASMRNGLAHAIWSGTRQPEEAWRWVRHLGSRECQAKVAAAGVVYPAIKGLAATALEVQRRRGADPSAFVDAAQGKTFAPPMAPRSAEVNDLMNSSLERVLSGRALARELLPKAAVQVRALTANP